MIIDELAHLKDYIPLFPSLRSVCEFMDEYDIRTRPEGRAELNLEGGFVNIQTVPAKTADEARLETHRKMIDVQIPLSGDETIGYSPLGELSDADYDDAADISFYKERAHSYVVVKRGMFAIFQPQDAHAPGVTPVVLKKAVFMIPVTDGLQNE